MKRCARAVLAVLLAGPVLVACGGDGGPGPQVRLVEGSRSQPAFPDAELRFEAPEPGSVVEDTAVEARLTLEGFELGRATPGADDRGIAMSSRGQHVHFIVDDRPYRALYELDGPVTVSGLEPGRHVLRAFPSRQWHESVKAEGALASTWFVVGDTAGVEAHDPGAPLLVYSRPKGTYAGDAADSVMVDFWVANADLGPGPDQHEVRLTVDDSLTWSITRWAPHYVLGLGPGEHVFRLELIAPDGSVAAGRLNTTERVITVEEAGG